MDVPDGRFPEDYHVLSEEDSPEVNYWWAVQSLGVHLGNAIIEPRLASPRYAYFLDLVAAARLLSSLHQA